MLPGEVIGEIVRLFAPNPIKYGDTEDVSPDLEFRSTELRTCSLVDREWCRRCRRVMFKNLYIRSAARLTQIIDSKPILMIPHVSTCVEYLYLYIADPPSTAPWIHRIATLEHFRHCTVFITFGDEAHRGWNGHAVDFMAKLPRRVPRSLFRGVWQLQLVGTEFNDAGDFLRPIGDLPKLYVVQCQSVKFPEGGPLPHNVLVGRAPTVQLRMKNCQGVSSAAELLRTSFCFRVRRQDDIPFPDIDALTKAATVLFTTETDRQITVTASRDRDNRAAFAIEDQVSVRTLKTGSSAATSVLYITLWDKDECLALLESAKWGDFEKALVGLHPLPDIEINTGELSHFAYIAASIEEGRILQELYPSGKMKILYKKGKIQLSMRDVLGTSLEYQVSGVTMKLTRRQAAQLRAWDLGQDAQDDFFKRLMKLAERRRPRVEGGIPRGVLDSDDDDIETDEE